MLKIDLHIHTKEDPEDCYIKYTARQLINKASELDFDAIAITLHNHLLIDNSLQQYAKKKGILLIPGTEITFKEGEVLVYNLNKKQFNSLKTLDDLRRLKKKDKTIFVIAPHPYYPAPDCIGKALEKNSDIFDAIESSWFYTDLINLNKKAIRIAQKLKKPVVATSDCHYFKHFGKNYSLINSKKDISGIFKAISNNKIQIVSKPLNLIYFELLSFKMITEKIIDYTKKYLYG